MGDRQLSLTIKQRIDVNNISKPFKTFSVVSLFSGCGGLDLGFLGGFEALGKWYERNPFNIIWANDIFKSAVETYKKNIGPHIYLEDITAINKNDIPKADVVIGGFPCQDFSVAGKRKGLTVSRGRLYLQMVEVLRAIRPIAFLAENVEGLVNIENGTVLKRIINDFESLGYRVYHALLNAADFGVPQIRRRVIIAGILSGGPFFPPKKTVSKWVTAREAIDDLWGKEEDSSIPNHNQISRAKFYPNKKLQGNNKIKADEPSVTIRAEHHGNIEGHYRSLNPQNPEDPTFWRRLSVRECARLQSFPDSFIFYGSATDAYKMVGNAVPPVFAWHVARALYLSLVGETQNLSEHSLELDVVAV